MKCFLLASRGSKLWVILNPNNQLRSSKTRFQISNDLELGEPGDTPVGDLIDNVSSVFGVSIKEGSNNSNFIYADKGALTFSVGYGGTISCSAALELT